jgi:GNAT superfamily N-acetyltransferase
MQRSPISVRTAQVTDKGRIIQLLARAFADDPALSYIFPNPEFRHRQLFKFFKLILASQSGIEAIDVASESGTIGAAAIWRGPGQWQTSNATMLRLIWPLLTTFGTALPRALRVQAALDAHHPRRAHWYLAILGTDPRQQGKGLGGATVRARLAQCDTAALPAALETATEANLAIYRSLGFAVTGEFDVPGGPHFWEMWREPQR